MLAPVMIVIEGVNQFMEVDFTLAAVRSEPSPDEDGIGLCVPESVWRGFIGLAVGGFPHLGLCDKPDRHYSET